MTIPRRMSVALIIMAVARCSSNAVLDPSDIPKG
jgi:hypothetical protein